MDRVWSHKQQDLFLWLRQKWADLFVSSGIDEVMPLHCQQRT